MNRTGSLFQQKTKAKLLVTETESVTRPTSSNRRTSKLFYPSTCFHYIHQNPLKAGLVGRLEEWEFSSFRDYAKFRNGTLCNKSLAMDLLDLPQSEKQFYQDSYRSINDSIIGNLY